MKLEFDDKAKLSSILDKIRDSEEAEIEISWPKDSLLASNQINQEIIKRFALDVGKKVSFTSTAAVLPTEELGFVEGQDIATLAPQSPAEAALPIVAPVAEGGKKPRLPKVNFSFFSKVRRRYWFGAGALLILALAAFAFLWLIPSASVTLSYEATTKNAASQITAVVGGETKPDEKIIAAQTAEVVKDDLATASTTGKKNVGDPAKGRVTITNRTGSSRFFAAGTIIAPISTPSATFRLDDDISVPASQKPIGDDGTAGVNVTAVQIGSAGNLAANTLFKVGSAATTDVYANNEIAFSGGSTKTVNTVADDDKKKLKAQLLDSLTQKASDEIKKQEKDSVIPDGAVEVTVSKETYDHEVGEEADKLSLSLEVTASAVTLQLPDLVKVLTQTMNIPSGFKVDENSSSATASVISKGTDTNYQIQGKIQAVLIPDIDTKQVSQKLAGKSIGAAKSYLDSLEAVKNYSIKFSPGFYSAFGFLPFSASKIAVRLEKS